ncbi:hypothetical protein [Anabaena sp. PCC 7108]|uniref:hypothetical protein n=1 Tax=Anabaena sp. PCC 7108 TaxID=163908 RepID=UPI000349CC59|nr:hypothetical protein [Anabaena sp. PCC 7108]
MIDSYDFEEDDFDIENEDLFTIMNPVSKMTEGEKLQRFKRFFDSSTRAMLQDCLFRIVDEDGTGTLEILCPNETVRQRLSKKKRKITNNISGCWSHIQWFSLCIQQDGVLDCQTFNRNGDRF